MSEKSTGIVLSWTATAKTMGSLLVGVVLGLALSRANGIASVLGYLVAGGCAIAFISVPFTGGIGKALCPVCGDSMEIQGRGGSYLRCDRCQEYFEARDRRLWQMDRQHIADAPAFAVRLPWDDLDRAREPSIPLEMEGYVTEKVMTRQVPGRVVVASWPPGCCVCGRPSTHTETVAQRLILPPDHPIGRDREFTIVADGVPHCAEHKGGAKFGTTTGEPGRFLKFRSYAYQTEFRQLNPWNLGRQQG